MGNSSNDLVGTALCAFLAVITFMALSAAVEQRIGWLTFLLGMLPMIMFGILAHYEGGWDRVLYVFNPRYQYWSFLFGDIALSLALWVAARGDRSDPWWWIYIVAPVSGVVGALLFHFMINKQGYIDAGNPTAIDSPTFRLHAVVTWPVLFAAVVAFLVPYILSWNWRTLVIVLLASVWVAGMAGDGMRNSDRFKDRFGTDLTKVHLPTSQINDYRRSLN